MNALLRLAVVTSLGCALSACVSNHHTMATPDYASAAHLISLCDQDSRLSLRNVGTLTTSRQSGAKEYRTLLSAQFLPLAPEEQRHFEQIEVSITKGPVISVAARATSGREHRFEVPRARLFCKPDGALVVTYDPDTDYVWAAWSRSTREIALWTNVRRDLIVHNTVHETYYGVVGGGASSDAWGRFESMPPILAAGSVGPPARDVDETGSEACRPLTGAYDHTGLVVHADGTLGERSAAEQFFREGLIGPHAVNQYPSGADGLLVDQPSDGGLLLSLQNGLRTLVTRHIEAGDVRCEDARWRVHGRRDFASPWLLLMGSGGVEWEDLILERNARGELLAWGEFRARNALFLIPVLNEQSLFMAFPPRAEAIEPQVGQSSGQTQSLTGPAADEERAKNNQGK